MTDENETTTTTDTPATDEPVEVTPVETTSVPEFDPDTINEPDEESGQDNNDNAPETSPSGDDDESDAWPTRSSV
jgi:hypothetical protein